MGFYLRKSLRVGPIRFNLSKSGIGVSAGLRGFRVGTGPRGHYVHMGRHGVYYRATLPFGQGSSVGSPDANRPPPSGFEPSPLLSPPAADTLSQIESGDLLQMCDSTSRDLLDEIAAKSRAFRFAPLFGGLAVLTVLLLLGADVPSWTTIVISGIAAPAIAFIHLRDQLRKTVVLFYELEPELASAYQDLHDAFGALSASQRRWHIEATGAISDWKRNAGASTTVKKRDIQLTKEPPPSLRTNIETPMIPAGRQKLYLFPDRVLVFDSNRVGAVGYGELHVSASATRFIEDGSVPSDAQVVDHTWRFVNKRGGPDRRFSYNRQLPILLYDDVHFTSGSGLNELFEFSRTGAGRPLQAAIERMARLSATDGAASVRPTHMIHPRTATSSRERPPDQWTHKGMCQQCGNWLYLYGDTDDPVHCGKPLVNISMRECKADGDVRTGPGPSARTNHDRDWKRKGMCQQCGSWVYLYDDAEMAVHCGKVLDNISLRDVGGSQGTSSARSAQMNRPWDWKRKGMCRECGQWVYLYDDTETAVHCGTSLSNMSHRQPDAKQAERNRRSGGRNDQAGGPGGREYDSFRREHSTATSGDDGTAFVGTADERYGRVLGLRSPTTPSMIKAAYREMLSRYHPDKVSHLGEEFQVIAEKKTRDIVAAYEYFRKKYSI